MFGRSMICLGPVEGVGRGRSVDNDRCDWSNGNRCQRGRGNGSGGHSEKPSVSRNEKSPLRKKPHAFLGATGMKVAKNGGRTVKDYRRGWHRSARSEAEEDREDAAKAARPRSLTERRESPLHQELAAPKASLRDRRERCAMRAEWGLPSSERLRAAKA
jgi:hypothetical protein